MRHRSIWLGSAIALAGMSAQAAAQEARNPVHCSVALQVAYELVKGAYGPDSALAEDLQGRLVWQGAAAARFPTNLDADADRDALRKQFLSDRPAAVAMAEACMRRQDAHPQFREARLERQLREGFSAEPLSAHASVQELKGLVLGKTPAATAARD